VWRRGTAAGAGLHKSMWRDYVARRFVVTGNFLSI